MYVIKSIYVNLCRHVFITIYKHMNLCRHICVLLWNHVVSLNSSNGYYVNEWIYALMNV